MSLRPEELTTAFPGAEIGTTADGTPFARVAPDAVRTAIEHARDGLGFGCFRDLTVVDDPGSPERFEVHYLLYSMRSHAWLRLKTRTAHAVPSIVGLFAAADWYEREAFDLFGVHFEGHPDLTRLMLPDDWQGHPLRRDEPEGGEPVDFTVTRELYQT